MIKIDQGQPQIIHIWESGFGIGHDDNWIVIGQLTTNKYTK